MVYKGCNLQKSKNEKKKTHTKLRRGNEPKYLQDTHMADKASVRKQ